MKRMIAIVAVTVVVLGVAAPRAGEAAYPHAGDKIAFSSDRSGNREIWVMNVDGSGSVNLTNDPASDGSPAWSPDGSQIAFSSGRPGFGLCNGTGTCNSGSSVYEIYVMNADGTSPRRLTYDGAFAFEPTWSPDGNRIAYTNNQSGNLEVYVIGADGTGEVDLTNSAGVDINPAWSPDGKRIAFASDRSGEAGGNKDVYIMGADGSGALDITNSAGSDVLPDWSPDGSRIAFASTTSGFQFAVFAIGADGFGRTPISPVGISESGPAWSPDGSRIAVSSHPDIYAMNADGSGQAEVTLNTGGDNSEPAWQPPQCIVESVSAGDAFQCVGGRSVRMLQIDAPAPGTCGGDWARAAMQYIFLTPGRTVGLKFDYTTSDADGHDLAAPIWLGNDGAEYNLSIVMAYVGLAHASVVPVVKQTQTKGKGIIHRNTLFLQWAQDSEAGAKSLQWNMWAPGKPFNGGC